MIYIYKFKLTTMLLPMKVVLFCDLLNTDLDVESLATRSTRHLD